jgi:nucleoside-diphosphate-sugar epimerase
MTRILITGVNGFIGATYANRALDAGMYVIGTDIQKNCTSDAVSEYASIDLSRPEESRIFGTLTQLDYILHAGGISGFMVERDNPHRILDVNVSGTVPVLELARRVRPRRLVLCSTIMVYGPDQPQSGPRRESEYPEPISVYGASKLAVEGLMHGYVGQHGVDALALRFSHVYGPGRTTECFVREMLAAVAETRPCRIPQAGASVRQYLHIEDAVSAIELAMAASTPRDRVFNISAGEVHSLHVVADIIRREVGELQVSFDETQDLPNYRVGELSIDRAREQLGYNPRLPLPLGLQRYWATTF